MVNRRGFLLAVPALAVGAKLCAPPLLTEKMILDFAAWAKRHESLRVVSLLQWVDDAPTLCSQPKLVRIIENLR